MRGDHGCNSFSPFRRGSKDLARPLHFGAALSRSYARCTTLVYRASVRQGEIEQVGTSKPYPVSCMIISFQTLL